MANGTTRFTPAKRPGTLNYNHVIHARALKSPAWPSTPRACCLIRQLSTPLPDASTPRFLKISGTVTVARRMHEPEERWLIKLGGGQVDLASGRPGGRAAGSSPSAQNLDIYLRRCIPRSGWSGFWQEEGT